MFNRNVLAALVLASTALVPTISWADDSGTSKACILRHHHVTSVKPLVVEHAQGHVTVKKPAGAELFIPAEPGLTAEWLQLELGRQIAHMRGASHDGCPFGDVQVKVDSAGSGFSVKLIARDSDRASAVLEHAHRLLQ